MPYTHTRACMHRHMYILCVMRARARAHTHTHTHTHKARPSAAVVTWSHGHLCTAQVLRVVQENPPGDRTGTP